MKFGAGQSVKRVEDVRLLTGKGSFTDDLQRDGMLYGVTLRSPYAHAEITPHRYRRRACRAGCCRRLYLQ